MNISLVQKWHDQLIRGEVIAVRALPMADDVEDPIIVSSKSAAGGQLIFPGAFNPWHAGHRGMADAAEEITARPVAFELSILNVEKRPTAAESSLGRLEQFPPQQTVWLTRAARFTEKAACFPAAIFIVGVDTIERIGDARYYAQDEGRCRAAIEEISQRGCRFLVFGRAGKGGFVSLKDVQLPSPLLDLCEEVSESRFRQDVSSSELRIARESP